MATGIFAILDDVATLLDDAAVMGKIAAKKTAGILGDDLAVNAEQATGFHASRELPVIWAITRGSLLNKVIILPLAFLLSVYLPGLIVPILLFGGTYLSFEGMEKVYEWLRGHDKIAVAARKATANKDLARLEAAKIRGAIRTDFILSIEIIIIALGSVVGQSVVLQAIVVSLIALLATIGVYGLVALLVRMDDVGFYLIRQSISAAGPSASAMRFCGKLLVAALPRVIRLLEIAGTLAMLLVGGGMFVHHIKKVHHALGFLPLMAGDLIAGLIVGSLSMALVHLIKTTRSG